MIRIIKNRGIQYKIPSGSSNNTVQKDLTPLFLSASNNEVKVGIGTNDPLGSFEITSTTPADITLRTNQDGVINVGEETGRIRFLIESSSFIINILFIIHYLSFLLTNSSCVKSVAEMLAILLE